jgi:hypothetical protein
VAAAVAAAAEDSAEIWSDEGGALDDISESWLADEQQQQQQRGSWWQRPSSVLRRRPHSTIAAPAARPGAKLQQQLSKHHSLQPGTGASLHAAKSRRGSSGELRLGSTLTAASVAASKTAAAADHQLRQAGSQDVATTKQLQWSSSGSVAAAGGVVQPVPSIAGE